MRYRTFSSHADYPSGAALPGQPSYHGSSPTQPATGDRYTSGIALPGQPSYYGSSPTQPAIGGGNNQKYPSVWETPRRWEAPDLNLPYTFIETPSQSAYEGRNNQSTKYPFNPYNVGAAGFLRNSWQAAFEKAKQLQTEPKIITHSPTAVVEEDVKTGWDLGWFGKGLIGLQNFVFPGFPDKWPDQPTKKPDQPTKNPEKQEVITDKDLHDPTIIPNVDNEDEDEPNIIDQAWNTWDNFILGVKKGWDEGGITDYRTPLLLAGGAVLLILIIK